jgi:hypothetical protein
LCHKTSAQAHFGCHLKVIAVGSHHHAFMGLDAKRLCSGKVYARLGFVVSCDLSPENSVPWKLIASGQINHERDISVRARS